MAKFGVQWRKNFTYFCKNASCGIFMVELSLKNAEFINGDF
ncbi:hypothetical protein [Helicobacter sp. 23-1045]